MVRTTTQRNARQQNYDRMTPSKQHMLLVRCTLDSHLPLHAWRACLRVTLIHKYTQPLFSHLTHTHTYTIYIWCADVASARGRNKEAYIREQLRRHMVVRRVVKPGYGEVVVYEHELANPFSQETVRVWVGWGAGVAYQLQLS